MASWTRFEVVDEHIMTSLKTKKERRQEGKQPHQKQLASFKYEQLFDVDVIKGATGNLTGNLGRALDLLQAMMSVNSSKMIVE